MAESTIKNAGIRFRVLNTLLKEYNWLINTYMLEFFTRNNFEKLPSSWKCFLDSIEMEEVGHFLQLHQEKESSGRRIWPLALLCIRKLLQTYSLSRIQQTIPIAAPIAHSAKEIKVTACMYHPRLKNLFVKHVKPKKRYEIRLMAEETAQLAAASNVRWVVDVGSGVGHLCRILAYGYALNVCGIESQQQLCEKAIKLDAELEVTASKHLSSEDIAALQILRPKHKRAMIGPNDSLNVIAEIVKNCAAANPCPDFGIIGLHPCGDLAVTLLRIFVGCPQAKFINIVGCCYHKMTFSYNPREYSGFPLSNFCAKEHPKITSEAASLGCHAIEAYSSRLILGDFDHLKVHCYRAALERIITQHWPEHTRWGLSNVSHYPDLTFAEYCRKALAKFPLPVPEEDFGSHATKQDLQSWKKVVFYHSLWLLLGPAIESSVLLDRLIYLLENGIKGQLKALFDASLSPRNQVLTAIKET